MTPDQTTEIPLAQQLTDMAAQEEVAALVQFALFRPHLADLLSACAEARLDLLVLKGAALAETVYPRPSLRRFGDLDVLVRRAEAARARTLLESLGYVVEAMSWDDLMHHRACQANFFKHTERGSVVIEMHTELINNDLFFGQIQVDQEGLWERARAVRLAGAEARTLGPEDQILHLCLHLAGHYLAAPQSLRDIFQVSSVDQMDWPLFVRLARQARAATACFAGLFAAARLLGAPVPPTVLDALAPRAGRRALEQIAAARAEDIAETHTERLRFPLLWRLLGSPRARLSALWHILFPSRRWLITHYYYDLFDAPNGFPPVQVSLRRPRAAARSVAHHLKAMGAVRVAHLLFLLRGMAHFFRR